ncbi:MULTISPECIES: NAD(P)/FAD-dependent oxidoreductase [Halomonadaceae]|uniref:NAD(P)/FAD-dependent oxidoreductase n=1 Tax=Halomonadaceae TaxID=28256 RepID=UPI001597A035|nr:MULTISPECIES: FAD-dependent oxidoreductase [Halomonas]QJQ96170.1 NAD(P)/FAD-dependent oxidoreductase [Halomonas sp. PA5]
MTSRHASQTAGKQDRLLIIGNGMAGHRLLEKLLEQPGRPARITVIGDERVPAYNRILLSPLLAGEMEREALTLRDAQWYAEQGIELILGERVSHIDRQARRVTTSGGRELDYRRLVLATGSRPMMPEVPGIALAGVHGFRDLSDAASLAQTSQQGHRAVVIGGGLLGLEAAEGLRKRGMVVSVVQRADRLMNRQLDATAAELLERELSARGLEVITAGRLASLEDNGQGQVAGITLEDGRFLPADCVVVAAGIVPNAELGRQAGLACQRAINVDSTLTTSDPAIHALGECCEHLGQTYGLVEPIWQQAEVLAAHLSQELGQERGASVEGYVERPCATKLKISGVSLYSFGPIEADAEHDVLTYHDPEHGDYRRLLLRAGRLEGAVLYGDTSMGPWYFQQALAERDLSACRQALLFGAGDATSLLESHLESQRLESQLIATDTPLQEEAA